MHIALGRPVERFHNDLRLSDEAERERSKCLRDQCRASHPQKISVAVGVQRVNGLAIRGHQFDVLRPGVLSDVG